MTHAHVALAGQMFVIMAEAFGEERVALSDEYVAGLLARPDFWAFAAVDHDRVVGGLTAHVLPMTAYEGAEAFLYDIAVSADRQREGIGRRLIKALTEAAAAEDIETTFVLADNEDTHALDFYRALDAAPSPVTMFELSSRSAQA